MSSILKELFIHPAKHIYNLVTKKDYLTYHLLESKIGKIPRYQDVEVKVNNWNLLIPDSASFLYLYKEIFLDKIYTFNSEQAAPKILDIGANIGMSVLFFKSLYPQADITAFEADPTIFNYLKKNIKDNGFHDVNLINKAVWHENTTMIFTSDGAAAGRIGSDNQNGRKIEVSTIDIAEILNDREYDFVKIDIEGAEESVLPRCQGLLNNVKHIFVEYHSIVGHKQCLDQVISILSDAGFRLHIHSVMDSLSPFTQLNTYAGFDLQLNIFAWKEK